MVVTFLLALVAKCFGGLALSEVIVNFDQSTGVQRDIVASNKGPDTLYVTTKVEEVINPGGKESRRTLNNPMKAELIVSPNRSILKPKGEQTLRFLLTQGFREKESIYRVTIVPKLGQTSIKGAGKKTKATGLKVMVGYEVLVIVRPKEINWQLDVKRQGKKLLVNNTGNTNVHLVEITQCDPLNSSNCQKLVGPRIYPGHQKEVALPFDGKVQVYQNIGSETVAVIY